MEIVITNDIDSVYALVAKGYCPVECSIGRQSITNDLLMDHHGSNSHLESVAVRAYRDHHGARALDKRFVGVGTAGADMTFAIASLAGLIPAGDPKVLELAELVAQVGTDPIGINLLDCGRAGDLLMTWRALTGMAKDSASALAATSLWTLLCGERRPGPAAEPLIRAARVSERDRFSRALQDLRERSQSVRGVLAVNGSRSRGFDVWYDRRPGAPPTSAAGWRNPVVLAMPESAYNITIGCPNVEVAEELFGPGGLKNVFASLDEALGKEGWGGREAICGSPRGVEMTAADLVEAQARLSSILSPIKIAGAAE